MAKLEIFIGYMGLIPQYHTLEIPEIPEIPERGVIIVKQKAPDVRLIGKPTKYFSQILFNYKKINKRFTQKINPNERK